MRLNSDGEPLLHYPHVYPRLPYTGLELPAYKSLQPLDLSKVVLRNEFHLAIIARRACNVHYRVFLICICNLGEELAPCSHQLQRMYFLVLQKRVAALKGKPVDIVYRAVKVFISY